MAYKLIVSEDAHKDIDGYNSVRNTWTEFYWPVETMLPLSVTTSFLISTLAKPVRCVMSSVPNAVSQPGTSARNPEHPFLQIQIVQIIVGLHVGGAAMVAERDVSAALHQRNQ